MNIFMMQNANHTFLDLPVAARIAKEPSFDVIGLHHWGDVVDLITANTAFTAVLRFLVRGCKRCEQSRKERRYLVFLATSAYMCCIHVVILSFSACMLYTSYI